MVAGVKILARIRIRQEKNGIVVVQRDIADYRRVDRVSDGRIGGRGNRWLSRSRLCDVLRHGHGHQTNEGNERCGAISNCINNRFQ